MKGVVWIVIHDLKALIRFRITWQISIACSPCSSPFHSSLFSFRYELIILFVWKLFILSSSDILKVENMQNLSSPMKLCTLGSFFFFADLRTPMPPYNFQNGLPKFSSSQQCYLILDLRHDSSPWYFLTNYIEIDVKHDYKLKTYRLRHIINNWHPRQNVNNNFHSLSSTGWSISHI